MKRSLFVLKEAAIYFLMMLMGGMVGLILGVNYGGNYGFGLPLFSPGYEGAGVMGFLIGVIFLVSLRIVFNVKKLSGYSSGVIGFLVLGLFTNNLLFNMVKVGNKWYLALVVIIIVPVMGFFGAIWSKRLKKVRL